MAFAAVEDVAKRLHRELSEAEQEGTAAVLEIVTGLIADDIGEDAEWAADLDPVPATFKAICIEKAIAAISNPACLAVASEQLGAYQHSETFRDEYGIFLTGDDQRAIRRALNRGSFKPVTLETPYSGDTPAPPLLP